MEALGVEPDAERKRTSRHGPRTSPTASPHPPQHHATPCNAWKRVTLRDVEASVAIYSNSRSVGTDWAFPCRTDVISWGWMGGACPCRRVVRVPAGGVRVPAGGEVGSACPCRRRWVVRVPAGGVVGTGRLRHPLPDHSRAAARGAARDGDHGRGAPRPLRGPGAARTHPRVPVRPPAWCPICERSASLASGSRIATPRPG